MGNTRRGVAGSAAVTNTNLCEDRSTPIDPRDAYDPVLAIVVHAGGVGRNRLPRHSPWTRGLARAQHPTRGIARFPDPTPGGEEDLGIVPGLVLGLAWEDYPGRPFDFNIPWPARGMLRPEEQQAWVCLLGRNTLPAYVTRCGVCQAPARTVGVVLEHLSSGNRHFAMSRGQRCS